MTPAQVEKLIGGYATGTLTGEERRALFAAALDNQELFDALADEEALRELLADPAYRQRLIRLLAREKPGLAGRLAGWLRRPVPLALAGGLAAAGLTVVVLLREPATTPPAVQVAAQRPAEQSLPAPPSQPLPAPASQPPAAAAEDKPAPAAKAKLVKEPPPTPDVTVPAALAEKPAEKKEADELRKAVAPATPVAPAAEQAALRQEAAEVADVPRRTSRLASASAPVAPFRHYLERLGEDGTYTQMATGTQLRAGDAVRLVVEAAESGHLSVVLRNRGGERPLFATVLAPGSRHTIPADGSLPSEAGERSLRLVYSRMRIGAAEAVSMQLFGRRDEREKAAAGPAAAPMTASNVTAPAVTVDIPLAYK